MRLFFYLSGSIDLGQALPVVMVSESLAQTMRGNSLLWLLPCMTGELIPQFSNCCFSSSFQHAQLQNLPLQVCLPCCTGTAPATGDQWSPERIWYSSHLWLPTCSLISARLPNSTSFMGFQLTGLLLSMEPTLKL